MSRKLELLDEKKKVFSTIIPFFDFMNHVDNNMDKVEIKYVYFGLIFSSIRGDLKSFSIQRRLKPLKKEKRL